ncbi:uncharacterized protein TM35_001151050, partial [Trypanosoma theileri]
GAVEVSCGAGGALRVRPAAESEWLTCGAGSRVSACGKYADLCRQRTGRAAARTTTRTAIIANTPTPTVTVKSGREEYERDGWANYNNDTWGSWGRMDDFPITLPTERNKNSQLTANSQGRRTDTQKPGEVLVQAHSAIPDSQPTKQAAASEDPAQNHVADNRSQDRAEERGSSPLSPNLPLRESTEPKTEAVTTTTQAQNPASGAVTQRSEETSGNAADNSTPADSNATQQSPATLDATAAPDSQENGNVDSNSTTPQSPENTTTEAPTTTPSPVPAPNTEISSITSTVQKNKANVDSSVSPMWMRTAAPLLIVVVLFSVTVY